MKAIIAKVLKVEGLGCGGNQPKAYKLQPFGKRKTSKMKKTEAQVLLGIFLGELGYMCESEYRFLDDRQFRFDWADLEHRIGYECDGGQFHGGHMRGLALEDQYEKDRLAQLNGWRIFRFTNRQILNGQAKNWLINNLGRQQ